MSDKFSRIIKILLAIVIAGLIALSCILPAFAKDLSYELKDIGVTMSIPDSMQVITRDTDKNDEVFTQFGFVYDEKMKEFEENNTYLKGVNPDNYLLLTVSMAVTDESKGVENYNNLTDEELKQVRKGFLAESPDNTKCKRVEINGITYMFLTEKTQADGKRMELQQYVTVANGGNYTFTLQASAGKKLNKAQKEMFSDIMNSTKIEKPSFFHLYGTTIIITVVSVVLGIGLLVLLIIFIKRITDPERKHRNLVHQLAHEHKISETTQVPRKKLYRYMIENAPEQTDFMEEYDPIEEIGAEKKAPVKKEKPVAKARPVKIEEPEEKATTMRFSHVAVPKGVSVKPEPKWETVADFEEPVETARPIEREEPVEKEKSTTIRFSHVAVPQGVSVKPEPEWETVAGFEEPVKEYKKGSYSKKAYAEEVDEEIYDAPVEEAEVIKESKHFSGTKYFTDVPDKREMYVYSDVSTAVEDYKLAKKIEQRRKRREAQAAGYEESKILKALKAVGKALLGFLQAVGMFLVYLVVHLRYFSINLYRLIKRKIAEKKRRKIVEERRRNEEERQRMRREAEMRRRQRNSQRGENDLIQVRSRNDVRNYQRNGYDRNRRRY